MKTTHSGLEQFKHAKLTAFLLASLGLACPATGLAQTDSEEEDSEALEVIEVKGMRASVISAQATKMNSNKIMDGISADDIGALPDRSITETLQRVAGVAIDRYMSLGDPEHFSVEGNGVIVRGLTQVRSELNGRGTFSADGGRTLSFGDVPPELLNAVNVYKSPSADQIEGGLAGTIDLETRLPFHRDGQQIAFDISANYGDVIKETKPGYSFLYSNNWDTSAGKVGFLFDIAVSELSTRNDSMYVRPFFYRDDIAGYEGSTVYVPRGADWRTMYFNRERNGAYAALQYAPSENHEFTLTYFSSDYDMQWNEDAIFVDNWPYGVQVESGAQFSDSGVLEKGRLVQDGGIPMGADVRASSQQAKTEDIALRYRYAGEQFLVETSLQRVSSDSAGLDNTVATQISVPYIDVDLTGSLPTVTSDASYLGNPDNYVWNFIMDNQYDRQADMTAADIDVQYFLSDGFFEAVKFGARYSKTSSDNADTGYNWSPLAPSWLQAAIVEGQENIVPDVSELNLNSFDNFFGGDVPAPANVYAPDASFAFGYPQSFQALQDRFVYADWSAWAYWNRRDLNDDQYTNDQTEETAAAYVMLDFFTDALGKPVSGNVGVRYVKTENTAHGYLQYPNNALFGNGAFTAMDAEHDYSNWLPSLNVKVELTDDLLLRFAAAKAMARPNFADLGANIVLNANLSSAGEASQNAGNPPKVEDYVLTLDSTQNPYLDPMESNQFDVSLEWYYAEDSSAYVALFTKDISGYQVPQLSQVEFGGYTYNARWPVSSADAEITGVELSLNHFFSSLPAPFDGFGVQMNYTWIDSEIDADSSSQPVDTDGSGYEDMPFRGLSENAVNLVLMYEKGPFSARLAYNWRDEFLIATNANGFTGTENGITYGLPLFNAATAYLDGSVTYRINDNYAVVLEANNLNDAVTKNEMRQNGPGNHYSAYHVNDIRYALSLRGNF